MLVACSVGIAAVPRCIDRDGGSFGAGTAHATIDIRLGAATPIAPTTATDFTIR